MIPTESFLKFSLSITNAATESNYIRLDRAGASGVIERIRVYSGSNLLEDLSSYGLLMANLYSLQSSNASTRTKLNVTTGLRSDNIVECSTTAATNATTFGKSYVCPGGEKLWSVNETSVIAANATTIPRTYCISLLSILGSLSSNQYLPLFAMTSGGLRIEIQLTDSASKFVCAHKKPASFSLNNVEYVGSFLELSDNSMEIINNSLMGQPLQYVIPSYRNYVHTHALPGSGAQINFPIAAKYSSLKSIFAVFRDSDEINNETHFPFSSSTFALSQYSLRVGSQLIPAKAPSTIAEFYSETLKAIGSISDLSSHPSMNMFSYSPIFSTPNTETPILQSKTSCSNTFLIGLDLEVYANADKESIYSGMNTLQSDLFLQTVFANTGIDTPSLRVDTFVMYDSLLICENGNAFAKF